MLKSSRKLLIVDDEPIARRSIARSLADPEYEIMQADCPAQALALLAEHDIKVVISDQHMPGVSGTSFLATVQASYPDVVRVLLTSDTSTDVFVAAVNEGHVRRVLYKPWADEQIRSVVRQCFGLPRRSPNAPPVYSLKPQTSRTLRRIAAILGVDKA